MGTGDLPPDHDFGCDNKECLLPPRPAATNDGCATEPEETKHGEDLYQNADEDDKTYVIDFKGGQSFGEGQQRKYRLLFSPKRRTKPGPRGPDADLIRAVIEMKHRNPTWGCPRIAQQINLAFGTSINKDVVRRIVAQHYQPPPNGGGPSWLTFFGHMKDSLWSLDLIRCESVALRTYWVLMVMDQYTRRVIGFGIQAGVVDGLALCRMFKQAIRGAHLPKYLSSDHDPLYQFHQWQANLRILGVTEIKTVPYIPWSHPFIERLIGTIEQSDESVWTSCCSGRQPIWR